MAGRAFPGEVWLRPQRNGRGFGLDELAQAAVRILDADGLEGLTMRRTAADLASWLGVPYEEIDYRCAGINHVAFYLRFERNGEDLYPALRDRILADKAMDRIYDKASGEDMAGADTDGAKPAKAKKAEKTTDEGSAQSENDSE